MICFFIKLNKKNRIPTIVRIVKNKTIDKKDSPIMFVMLVCNGFIWAMYGILASDSLVSFANICSIVLGIIYVGIFYNYCHNKMRKNQMARTVGGAFLLMTLLFMVIFNMQDVKQSINYLGLLGSLTAILLMASPLSSAKQVIKDQTSKYLPIPAVITSFFNAFAWTLYGLIIKDPFISVPNTLGLIAAVIQICLLFAFPRDNDGKDGYKPNVDEVGQLL